eukprot:1720663-Alexandrium_andersonii.AAC.1
MLAGLGSDGQLPNNCMRDLARRLPPSPLREAASTINLPMKIGQVVANRLQSVLLPHELFAVLWAHRREAFAQRLSSTAARLASF